MNVSGSERIRRTDALCKYFTAESVLFSDNMTHARLGASREPGGWSRLEIPENCEGNVALADHDLDTMIVARTLEHLRDSLSLQLGENSR